MRSTQLPPDRSIQQSTRPQSINPTSSRTQYITLDSTSSSSTSPSTLLLSPVCTAQASYCSNPEIYDTPLYSENNQVTPWDYQAMTKDFRDTAIRLSNHLVTQFALSGPAAYIKAFQLAERARIPSEDSPCGHAVLSDKELLFIADGRTDWRYE
jgi:hypothetical protein